MNGRISQTEEMLASMSRRLLELDQRLRDASAKLSGAVDWEEEFELRVRVDLEREEKARKAYVMATGPFRDDARLKYATAVNARVRAEKMLGESGVKEAEQEVSEISAGLQVLQAKFDRAHDAWLTARARRNANEEDAGE